MPIDNSASSGEYKNFESKHLLEKNIYFKEKSG